MAGLVLGNIAKDTNNKFTASNTKNNDFDFSIIPNIKSALENQKDDEVLALLSGLHSSNLAMILDTVKSNERNKVLELIADHLEPELLLCISHQVRLAIIDVLGYKKVGSILDKMINEGVIEFLEYFPLDIQLNLLKHIPPTHRKRIKLALNYPERSAGRVMDIDYVVVTEDFTAGEAIEYIRYSIDHLPHRLYDIFIVDGNHNITGIVPSMSLLKHDPGLPIKSISNQNFITIKASDSRRDVAYTFNKYDLDSAPVIDEDGKLVGVITIDSVKYIADQENEEELLKMSGVLSDLDEGIGSTTRIRFVWLFVNLITTALSSWVISFFEHEIQAVTALAVLMPITVSMGCNAGTQTITVIIRAIATKNLNQGNFKLYFGREMTMALINGLLFCVVCTFGVYIVYQRLDLSIIFGAAIFITLLTGAISGVLSPILMKKLNTDPAITAVVFLTTITDIVAFLSFLGLARMFL